ncbi:hypothetical protein BS47DRAFT_1337740, partial [Hydnum rufescens UP504]
MREGPSDQSLVKTCPDKLAAFLRDPDQNLKCISLLAMAKIVPLHPHLVSAHQDGIISSIEDQDISLRMRALDLVSSMPNLSHAQQQQRHPMSLAISVTRADASPTPSILTSASRLEVSWCIIAMCSRDAY